MAVCALLLLAINGVIAAKLFGVEYLSWTGSVEGSFIAIARVMAQHPAQWGWWPLWSGGMPFENTYLPLTPAVAAALHQLTGLSPARSFHIVTALCYVLGAPALFWMAFAFSGRLRPSFIAALAYSVVSPSALLIPAIAADAGGALNLRRLQALTFYGEGPHILALTLLPIALVAFHRRWHIIAGLLAALVAMSNAFGITTLAAALLCWMIVYRPRPWWSVPAIGVASYCFVSPWLSPSMIRAIRLNAPTAGGDFRYTPASWIALASLTAGFIVLRLVLERARVATHLKFFTLFAYFPTAIVLTWYVWGVAVIAQPHRYHLEMDLALILAVAFVGADLLERPLVITILLIAFLFQMVHGVRYAHSEIRSVDPSGLVEYKIAKWMDQHHPGERAFITGSSSLWYNVFTDNPQLHGGHDQFIANPFIRIAAFTIYSGANAGARDAEYSVFWLKAFGAHAVSVSGPASHEYYKPFTNPRKFDGVLPVLWHEGDDTIYEVPSPYPSLAHVMPASAIPARTPIHGLDIDPVAPYVAALENPLYPPASFQWKGMNEAAIRASLEPGQVVAVQITYDPGWEAHSNGRRQPVHGDAIGQMVIAPDCQGPCEITLRYTGGPARRVTRVMSLLAILVAMSYAWLRRRAVN